MFLCVHMNAGVHRGQLRIPWSGVTDGCELPDVGAGSLTLESSVFTFMPSRQPHSRYFLTSTTSSFLGNRDLNLLCLVSGKLPETSLTLLEVVPPANPCQQKRAFCPLASSWVQQPPGQTELGVMVHICNPRAKEVKTGGEFKVSHSYLESSRLHESMSENKNKHKNEPILPCRLDFQQPYRTIRANKTYSTRTVRSRSSSGPSGLREATVQSWAAGFLPSFTVEENDNLHCQRLWQGKC